MLKQGIRRLSHSQVFSACVTSMERWASGRDNLLNVLTYHRVAEPSQLPFLYTNAISATPAAFENQVRHLVDRFRVVGISELLAAIRGDAVLPPRALLITFDDAYRDFLDHAWPVLRRHRLPVTLFVPTGFPENPQRAFWWDQLAAAIYFWPNGQVFDTPAGHWWLRTTDDRQAALRGTRDYVKSLPHAQAIDFVQDLCRRADTSLDDNYVLSWDCLRQLASDGVTLGAHTQTHPLLNRITPDEACREAVDSLRDLRRQIGETPRVFAYPSGGFSDAVVETLRPEFDLAFTTCRGVNNIRHCDPLRIRRINVSHETAYALVRAQLLPTARWLNACWPLQGSA